MATVITISGKAEAGKDFSSIILKEKFEKLGKKVLIVHYADYLKFIAKKYFGWNGEKDIEGRTLLQYLGTDVVRKRMPDFWVTIIMLLIEVFEPDFDYILIPDTRFPNEIKIPKEKFNVTSIWVRRLDHKANLTPEQEAHESETSLDDYKFDYYLNSLSGKPNMSLAIDAFLLSRMTAELYAR